MMPTTKEAMPETIKEMKRAIEAITKRPCVSDNERYLKIRLAELRRGVRVPATSKSAGSRKMTVPVSMTADRVGLLAEMCRKASISIPQLFEKAFDEYAVKNGYGIQIQHIHGAAR